MRSRMLTAKALSTIRPAARTEFLADIAVGGLGVRWGSKGVPSFTLVYRVGGRQRRVALGRWWSGEGDTPPGWTTLAAARAEAVRIKEAAATGIEAAPGKTLPAVTVGTSLGEYAARHLRGLKTGKDVARTLRKELAPWADRALASITRAELRGILDALVAAGKPIMANRTRSHLAAFFNDAVERDLLSVSPMEKIRQPAKAVRRERVLTDAELVQVWNVTAPAPTLAVLRILLLTGQRRGETAAMEWSELDLAIGEWRIPATKTKTGKPHTVHLCQLALGEIAGCHNLKSSPFVFTFDDRQHIAGDTITKGFPIAGATVHDLRRTFATGLQKLGVEYDVREICLNHIAGGVAAVYARHDYLAERKAAFLQWGEYVAKLL